LTFPAVALQAPVDETASVSRQAHEHRFIDGRPWEHLSHRAESAKCYAALIPRIGDETYSRLRYTPSRARQVPTSRLQAAHILGRASDPNSRFERLNS
jgi:hypothetical protein